MTDNEIRAVVNSYTKTARNDFSGAIVVGASDMIAIHDFINRQKAEIERLCMELDEVIIAKDLLFDEAEALIKKTKAEAIKEFAERLKEIITMSPKSSILIDKWYIDNLVKELVGEG